MGTGVFRHRWRQPARRAFIPGKAPAPQSVTMGLATETDTAFDIPATPGDVSVAVGLATTSSSGLSITPIGGDVSLAIGLASETDTAFTITPLSDTSLAIGLATETDTAFSVVTLPGDAAQTVGLSQETDTGFTVSPSGGDVSVTLGLSTETDTALSITPLAGAVSVAVGLATETDTALSVSIGGLFHHLEDYALSAANPQLITVHGCTLGADVWLFAMSSATISTPIDWVLETSRVDTMGNYIFRLPGIHNPGGDIPVILNQSAARAMSIIAMQAPLVSGTPYESLVLEVNTPGSSTWGTDSHTFTQKHNVFALYYLFAASGTPPAFTVSSYDTGFTAFADSGWAGTGGAGDDAVRILAGFKADQAITGAGVTVTLSAAGPTGDAVGFLAFDDTGGVATPTIIGLGTETDTAFTITPTPGNVSVAIGLATDTETAFDVVPLGGAVSQPIGLAVETDTAFTVNPLAEFFKLLDTYALSTATTQNLTIHSATAGADLWLIVNTTATITTPSGWTLDTSRVATNATYVYHLPGTSNPGGNVLVSLVQSGSRALVGFAIQTPLVSGTPYESLVAPTNNSAAVIGTDAHTFTSKHNVLAIYDWFFASGTPGAFTITSYDNGFVPLADSGWAGSGSSGDDAVRIAVGFGRDKGFTADGVTLTISTGTQFIGAVGFVAFDDTGTLANVLGIAIETDTAFAIVPLPGAVSLAIGLATETDTAFSVTPTSGLVPLGLATETDTAFAITATPGTATVSTVGSDEFDSAFDIIPLPGAVSLAIGLASETDTALTVTPLLGGQQAVGQALETDTAFTVTPLGGSVSVAVGLALETYTAFSVGITGDVSVPISQALETDTAFAVTTSSDQSLAIGLALETDTGFTVVATGGDVSVAVGLSLEADTAFDAAVSVGGISVPIGLATDTETANTVSTDGAVTLALGQVLETDTAFDIQPASLSDSVLVNQAIETNTAFSITPNAGPINLAIGLAVDTETAFSIIASPGDVFVTVSQAMETDSSFLITPIGGPANWPIGIAIEHDTGLRFVLGDLIPPRYTITLRTGMHRMTLRSKKTPYTIRSG